MKTLRTDDFPLFKRGRWAEKSDFILLNWLNNLVWTLRLLSPASWINPFFTITKAGRVYSHPRTAELYAAATFIPTLTILFYCGHQQTTSTMTAIWGIIIILENIQYQLQAVFLRPVFQRNYNPYSPQRTLAIFLLQYIHTLLCYAIVYWNIFSDSFSVSGGLDFGLTEAIEFSAVTITTLGYGSIYATPGSPAALIASTEAILGVFYLGLAISIAVNRTNSSKSIKVTPSPSIYLRCKSFLEQAGYFSLLLDIGRGLNNDLWVVGGWVRSSALNVKYMGDIDCLTTLSISTVKQRLEQMTDLNWNLTRLNGLRSYLPDGNHIDISSTITHCGDRDIRKSLRRFNFSVNAGAVNFGLKKFLSTPSFDEHVKINSFDFLDPIRIRKEEPKITLLRDFEVLEKHYELKPLDQANHLKTRIADYKYYVHSKTSDQLLRLTARKINHLIPPTANAWMVRGYVRCAILGDLEYWDDIDIVVGCNRTELYDHLDKIEAEYTTNYYSNPKILTSDGKSLDIWPLPETANIDSHVSSFLHSADMLYWDIRKETLGFPEEKAFDNLKNRVLEVNTESFYNSDQLSRSYCIIKTLYLIFRHQFTPQKSAIDILSQPLDMNAHLAKNTIRLIQELKLCGIKNFESRIIELVDFSVGSSITNAYRAYWNPFAH